MTDRSSRVPLLDRPATLLVAVVASLVAAVVAAVVAHGG
jgi:hypothetical protein